MSSISRAILCAVVASVGFVSASQGSAVAQYVAFSSTLLPNQNLLDVGFHYGLSTTPAGGTLGLGNFTANQSAISNQVVQVYGGLPSLLPTYTVFSLYSAQAGDAAPIYGIMVAINQADYATAGGENFNQLFQKNIDAAFNDGNVHTEDELINEFLTNGSADSDFTAGIDNTPAAEIPFGQTAVLALFSAGTNGGTIDTVAFEVPEPASLAMLGAGCVLLSRRRL